MRKSLISSVALTAVAIGATACGAAVASPPSSKHSATTIVTVTATATAPTSLKGPPFGESGSPAPTDPLTDPALARAAQALGVSRARLLAALPVVKRAAGQSGSIAGPQAAAALATALGVTESRAQAALALLFPGARPGAAPSGKGGAAAPDSTAVALLARRLGITQASATALLSELQRLSRGDSGIDPSSSQFAEIAEHLGRTPAQLAAALQAWKQSLGGGPG